MKTLRLLSDIPYKTQAACALGVFDGVHLGHRVVLENALRQARQHNVPSVVLSFANHPQTVISKTPTPLLSSLPERLEQFEAMGFDYAVMLDFDETLKNLPAGDFVQQILLEGLHIQSITVGYDHRFGRDRQGDGEFLTRSGQHLGFQAFVIEPVRWTDPKTQSNQIISSTLIRKLLSYGDITQANSMLGRPYALSGTVVHGLKRGRQLGFPTANLSIDPHRLIPAVGTYGGHAVLAARQYPAVCNVGYSPTFNDAFEQKRLEVHLLGYAGPSAFYDQPLTMHFEQKLRDERNFASVDELIAQIQQDCQRVLAQHQPVLASR